MTVEGPASVEPAQVITSPGRYCAAFAASSTVICVPAVSTMLIVSGRKTFAPVTAGELLLAATLIGEAEWSPRARARTTIVGLAAWSFRVAAS